MFKLRYEQNQQTGMISLAALISVRDAQMDEVCENWMCEVMILKIRKLKIRKLKLTCSNPTFPTLKLQTFNTLQLFEEEK